MTFFLSGKSSRLLVWRLFDGFLRCFGAHVLCAGRDGCVLCAMLDGRASWDASYGEWGFIPGGRSQEWNGGDFAEEGEEATTAGAAVGLRLG